MGNIFQSRNAAMHQSIALDSITLGTVVSNTDPHQMGRLKIICQGLGDNQDDLTGDSLPWATMMSNFGGTTNSTAKRGPGDGVSSKGPIAYGMWNIPRVGSTVVVACIDGDPYYRIWMGSVFDQGSVSSLPHGRYFYQGGKGEPDGPLDSYEEPIEPLYTNLGKAFGAKKGNYEWRTRGADFSVAGNVAEFTEYAPSTHPDETVKKAFKSKDGKSFDVKNGYAAGRVDGQEAREESSVFSWTTPGFHTIAMDDRPENCRIRVRSTCGAQILMDDTNERMYISTPQGENYIEMDYNGNIDIHGRRVAIHSTKDMNFTSDETIRFFGKTGIHMVTPKVINMQAAQDINIGTNQNVRVKALQGIFTESVGATNVKATKEINVTSATSASVKATKNILIEAGAAANVKAGAAANVQAGAGMNLKAGGQLLQTGAQIHFNGPAAGTAAPATPAEPANPEKAKWTNRIPVHEPFVRGLTKDDYTHDPELTYDDPNVGIKERDDTIKRGKLWRR